MTAPRPPHQPPPRKNRTNLIAILSVVALLVVGGVVAVVVTATRDGEAGNPRPMSTSARTGDPDAGLAAARDAAVEDGTAAAVTLNSVDAAHIERDLDRWESVTTGALHDEIAGKRAEYLPQLRDAKTTSVAKALAAALAELDEQEGTARLLVAVHVEVSPEGKEQVVKRLRLVLDLTRTADGWKAAAIEKK